ncbi:hypothetical protein [Algibacter sp. L1A34]|uniref:hypothetical protein n=1 Tax=Algibacter sp. L1A34 TaxID=2686365 RepID=UPI00131B3670|nr:hypothetical protein [Algibacter sp. L1A34]
MKKLLFKSGLYFILILIALELLVRAFHLGKDSPSRYIDEYGVEKWEPNQDGYSVTGNRRQNFSAYRINKSGFNSYREFNPTIAKTEIALVGDSFIQGFHQDFYDSVGKKIENQLRDVEVYEYGYAGYDFADQLHLLYQYKDTFDKIDYVVLGLRFRDDLFRGEYQVVHDRMRLESSLYKNLRKIKLLVYAQSIGVLDSAKKFPGKIISLIKGGAKNDNNVAKKETLVEKQAKQLKYIKNFELLIEKYGYDKSRYVLLIDKSKTPIDFLVFLENNHFKYIDFGESLNNSKIPPTLIFDQHWNNHGRNLIADCVVKAFKTFKSN